MNLFFSEIQTMTTFQIRNAPQVSLLAYLQRTGQLITELTTPGQLPDMLLRSAIDHSSALFRLQRSHVYTGRLTDVVLAKRKYFCTDTNDFLAEGLTHSDYFITWEGFDESGLGKGSELVRSRTPIELEERPITTISDQCIFIGGDTIVAPNFAHWFFEHLLKLQAIKLSGVDMTLPVVVSNRIPERFLEWAEILIGHQLNWRRLDLSNYVKFKDTIVSSCPAYRRKADAAPTIWDEGFDYLNSLFSAATGLSETSDSNDGVYFIGRGNAKWRRAVNENELLSMAERELDAKNIEISQLSIADQIALVKRARVLIIFAGADGPITTFCNPRCRVIEFAAPNHTALYTSPVFCAVRGIRWSRLVAERFVTEVKGPHPLDADYWVDPEKARAYFRAIKETMR